MAISLVHVTRSNSTTVTIPATTAGNCLVVCIASFNSAGAASISGITLGGSAGNFSQLASADGTDGSANHLDAIIWADPGCAGGQTSVAISGTNLDVSAGAGGVIVYEFSGLATTTAGLLDKSSTGASSGTSSGTWSSGSTATTTQAAEAWVGVAEGFNNLTAPGAPWTDESGTLGFAASGFQITTSTGTATYSGTQSPAGGWGAAVVTLKPPGGGVTVSPFTPPRQSRGRPAAVRGTGKGSPGAAYIAFPSAFIPPRKPARGARAALRGRIAATAGTFTHVIPPGPAPFTLPVRPAKGQTARRGSSAAHNGAPYVAFPSPFTQPGGPARAVPPARRGTGKGSPGAAYVAIPAPFTLPARPARGAQAARRGRGTSSPGARFVLIQTAPFTLPRKPARGRAILGRGRWSAGSATGKGAPVVPRKLIVSIASAAGIDDYGNTFPQGLQARAGVIEGPTIIGSNAFYYSGGVPASGMLIASVAQAAGTDTVGNAYLAGSATYGGTAPSLFATSLQGGVVQFWTATSAAGPWTLYGQIEITPAIPGVLVLDFSRIAGAINTPQASGATTLPLAIPAPSTYSVVYAGDQSDAINKIWSALIAAGILSS